MRTPSFQNDMLVLAERIEMCDPELKIGGGVSRFGVGSLRQDVKDLDRLLRCLSDRITEPRLEDSASGLKVAIIGHSTGCQQAVMHARHGTTREIVAAIVLQGPVSDREYLQTLDTTDELVSQARELVASGRPVCSPVTRDPELTTEHSTEAEPRFRGHCCMKTQTTAIRVLQCQRLAFFRLQQR